MSEAYPDNTEFDTRVNEAWKNIAREENEYIRKTVGSDLQLVHRVKSSRLAHTVALYENNLRKNIALSLELEDVEVGSEEERNIVLTGLVESERFHRKRNKSDFTERESAYLKDMVSYVRDRLETEADGDSQNENDEDAMPEGSLPEDVYEDESRWDEGWYGYHVTYDPNGRID